MKITATLNGVKMIKEIPTAWGEKDNFVTFEKFLKLKDVKTNEYAKLFSILLDLDEETMKKATVQNLMDEVVPALAFMRRPLPQDVPKSIIGYLIPKDLNLEQVARYADLELILGKMPQKEEEVTTDHLKLYCDMCTVYSMPNYIESTDQEKIDFALRFMQAPCSEVMAVGNFTHLKWIASNLNIALVLPLTSQRLKRWTLAFRIWRSNLAFTLRYYLWRRKLRTKGMSS